MEYIWSRFLISSSAWVGYSYREAIEAARQAGFAGIEILCAKSHFDWENPSVIEEVRAALGNWPKVQISFHAPFDTVDLSSSNPEQWQEAFDAMTQALKVARQLNAKTFVIHPRNQANGPNWSASNLPAFQNSVSRLMHLASRHRIVIAIENTGVFTSNESNMIDILELLPPHGVGACFDTGHAQLSGNLLEYSRLITPRASVLHIHDNDGKSDQHLLPGEGTIDWDAFVEIVLKRDFHAQRVIEVRPVGTPTETIEKIKESILKTALKNL